MARTKVGIIGAGNMGSAFATRLTAAGHDVTIATRDPAHAEQAAAKTGGKARAVRPSEIARNADIIILATPYAGAVEAVRGAGNLSGKTVIDVTNPLTADFSGLTLGFTTSGGEEIQKAAPQAKVVKAFNTIFSKVLEGKGKAQVFIAGDDAAAKDDVKALAESMGFEAVDTGPLANARLLEPLAMLTIFLGYVGGRGTGISPAFVAAG